MDYKMLKDIKRMIIVYGVFKDLKYYQHKMH